MSRVVSMVVALTASLLLLAPPSLAADPGELDPDFDSDGKVTTDFGASEGIGAVLVQSDGKLVAAGSGESTKGWVLARYLDDGSLDTSFGGDGKVEGFFTHPVTAAGINALAQQADGKLVAAGMTPSGTGSIAVGRFGSDGAPDPTFDGDGFVVLDLDPAESEAALGVAVQPDGKIVVAGDGAAAAEFVVVRFLPDGSLDTSFDGDGIASGSGFVTSVALQADGKIVVAGGTDATTQALSSGLVARFTATGAPDSTFDGDGVFIGPGATFFDDAALQADGKIVTAGRTTGSVAAVARYLPGGGLDTSFAGDGVAEPDFGALAERATGVAVQPDGKIVAGGWAETAGMGFTADFAVARLTPVGGLDTSFGGDGKASVDGSFHSASDVALQGSRIVLGGRLEGSPSDFALARFVGSSNEPPVAVDDGPFGVDEGATLTVNGVLENDSDPDGDPLTAVLVDGPDHGTLDLDPDGSFTYVHDGSETTTDSFMYRASDGAATSNAATATITVAAVNDPPVAAADGPFAVDEAATLTVDGVLDNDSDPEGGSLTAVLVDGPDHGTLDLDPDGSFTYTHDGSETTADSFTYRATDGAATSNAATVGIAISQVGATVGLVDPAHGRWHLRDDGGQVTSFFFGNPGDVPVTGDWDCDGTDTPGLFRQSDAFAYLSDANRSQIADTRFFFGDPADVPLAGDFDGDGCDTLSIYRPSEGRFYIVNALGEDEGGLGPADFSFGFGNLGDKPVVGDWDGDGIDEVGLHRESTGFFYWRNTLSTGIADGEIFFGDPGDRFVAGDWGTVDGADTPAVFRPADATFYFRHTLTQGNADAQVGFGEAPWLPVAGEFGL